MLAASFLACSSATSSARPETMTATDIIPALKATNSPPCPSYQFQIAPSAKLERFLEVRVGIGLSAMFLHLSASSLGCGAGEVWAVILTCLFFGGLFVHPVSTYQQSKGLLPLRS